MSNVHLNNFPYMLNLNYKLFDPAGNLTALVTTQTPRSLHPYLAQYLSQMLKVEQVGFIEKTENSEAFLRLQMPEGELCGNALACAGLLALQNQGSRQELVIEASGTSELVKISQIQFKSTIRVNFNQFEYSLDYITDKLCLVRMQGISHIIVSSKDPNLISMTLSQEIKLKVNPVNSPACGVIFASKKGSLWSIKPFIFVGSAKIPVAESACATGTLAVALFAWHQMSFPNMLEMQIIQPSTQKLNVNISANQQEITQIKLDVPVNGIGEGNITINI